MRTRIAILFLLVALRLTAQTNVPGTNLVFLPVGSYSNATPYFMPGGTVTGNPYGWELFMAAWNNFVYLTNQVASGGGGGSSALTFAAGVSNNLVTASNNLLSFAKGASNNVTTASNAVALYAIGVSNTVPPVVTYATAVSNNVVNATNSLSSALKTYADTSSLNATSGLSTALSTKIQNATNDLSSVLKTYADSKTNGYPWGALYLAVGGKAATAGTADTANAGWPTTWAGSAVTGATTMTNGLATSNMVYTASNTLQTAISGATGVPLNGTNAWTGTNTFATNTIFNGPVAFNSSLGISSSGSNVFGNTVWTNGAATILASVNATTGRFTGSTTNTTTAADYTGNTNSFLQVRIKNSNSGTNASSDFVAEADNGDDGSYYVNLGINSSGYTNYLGATNDAYLYVQGGSNAAAGANLYIGTVTTNASYSGKINFVVGTNINVVATISSNAATMPATAFVSVTNSALTASRLVFSDANKKETSAAASGAVPVNADGSASTHSQINGVLWQREVIQGMWPTATLTAAAHYSPLSSSIVSATTQAGNYSIVTAGSGTGGYLTNLTLYMSLAIASTTNVPCVIMTNVVGTAGVASSLALNINSTSQWTNSASTSCPCAANGWYQVRITPSAALATGFYIWSVEWWHQ